MSKYIVEYRGYKYHCIGKPEVNKNKIWIRTSRRIPTATHSFFVEDAIVKEIDKDKLTGEEKTRDYDVLGIFSKGRKQTSFAYLVAINMHKNFMQFPTMRPRVNAIKNHTVIKKSLQMENEFISQDHLKEGYNKQIYRVSDALRAEIEKFLIDRNIKAQKLTKYPDTAQYFIGAKQSVNDTGGWEYGLLKITDDFCIVKRLANMYGIKEEL